MSQVRTRKRGKTFSYIFEAGKKDDGKRKVVEKGGFLTKKDAYDAGVSAYNDWKHGNIGIISENISVKNFFQNWLEKVLSPTVKIHSLQIYQSMLRKHILPTLGVILIQNLTSAILDKFILKLFTGGYSKNTISQIHAMIHRALNYAVYPSEIIFYIGKCGYYFSTLKTESSNRNIVIDDFLTGELRRWQNKQTDNENSAGKTYLFVYKNAENKILQQSKGLGKIDAEKIFAKTMQTKYFKMSFI